MLPGMVETDGQGDSPSEGDCPSSPQAPLCSGDACKSQFSHHDLAGALGRLRHMQAIPEDGLCGLRRASKESEAVSTRAPSKDADSSRAASKDDHYEPLSARSAPWGLAVDTAAEELEAPFERVLSPVSLSTIASCSHLERWSDRDETLIIFDWDDTLCPTTHGQENPECAEQDRAQLQAHEEVVARLLRVAGEVGHISIVSMAGTGWIERTLDNFMPGLKPLIAELNIPVTLAREGVPKRDKRQAFAEGREPSTYLKRRTMMKVVRNFYRTSIGNETKERSWKNVVSIGDSTAEKLALQDIVLARVQRDRKGRWKDCRCKTIKLKTEPTLAELSAQLCRVAESLPALVMHDGDLDMEFEEEEVQEAIAHYDLARHHVCADGPP
mmetsp:Transcript_48354/g.136020  ORF Transcript_48354/g.136020 Transcript_48354/m.136020 type:complete len:384 (-) Transcript_48354:183-1334(-)